MSPSSGTTDTMHKKKSFTDEDVSATMHNLKSILDCPESPQEPQLDIVISEETTATTTTTATQQVTLSIPNISYSTEATIITTITATNPFEITMTGTSASALLISSESTSGSLHNNESKEEHIARKIRERQEIEQQMIFRINAEAEAKEEEERKRRLKEQSDADREYMLEVSGELAKEREREILMKKEQEEFDYKMAKLLEDVEKSELQKELDAETKGKGSKKKGGVNPSVDKLWNEIDRRKYAARMTGRSNPAPITKVYLKKPKNKSQAQLLIHRGTESQAIALDQVCKLHREEWNEIRLAVSHSSSAAKREVLNEIDRLFQKMVDLQLLRPEDTIIHGEEIVQPPSPKYRSGTSSIYRIPNTSRLNLSIPDGVPRIEGTEVIEGEKGLVYRDFNGMLKFQRESELEKIDHEQLVHLIKSVSMLPKNSSMRKAILEEGLARQFRYLPSAEKYELADELGVVKQEEIWSSL